MLEFSDVALLIGADGRRTRLRIAGQHDRAGGRLVVPENVILMPLPPYAPELNPTENIWEFLRGGAQLSGIKRVAHAPVDNHHN